SDVKQVDPAKPFYLHLCFGATHAPHHVPKEWADRYAGQFDEGWDAYREKVFARQKELGIAPADAELSRHDPAGPDWGPAAPEAARARPSSPAPATPPPVHPDDGGFRWFPVPRRSSGRASGRVPAHARGSGQ